MVTTEKVLAALEHLGVGVVDGHVEAKSLEEDVLVVDQLLGLFVVRLRGRIKDEVNVNRWRDERGSHLRVDVQLTLVGEDEHVSDPDDVLQLPGLLLHLGC